MKWPIPSGANRRASVALVIVLTAVLVALALGAGTASAASEQRKGLGTASAPVFVFQGEELDVRQVTQSGGSTIGSGSVRFVGLSGNADGESQRVSDASRVDFTDFQTGTYDTDGDGKRDVVVQTPVIRDLAVRTDSGAEVTGGSIPADSTVNILARFNFDAADRVEISVIGPDGIEVTGEVLGTRSARHVTTDGGSVQANFAGQSEGTYRIEAKASGLDATKSTTVTIRSGGPTVALDKQTVSKGETVVATILGTPGEQVHLRIPSSNLDGIAATDEGARRVFDGVGDVTNRVGDGNVRVVAAVVRLDERGEGRVRIQSRTLKADSTTRIELARGTDLRARSVAQTSLRVDRRAVTISRYPATVTAGSDFTIAGRAPGATHVKAYARVDGQWRPLFRNAGQSEYAHVQTGDRGEFTLRIDSSRVIDSREPYLIGVAADARDTYRADQTLSSSEFGRLDTDTVTVRVAAGVLQASLSQPTLAYNTGDQVRLSIDTGGDTSEAHLYLVSHRGEVMVSEAVSTRSGTAERRFSKFPGLGEYRFVVVTRGGDGRFESTVVGTKAKLNGRETQTQALEKIRAAYGTSGSDDNIRELRLPVELPTLSLTSLPQTGPIEPGRIQFAGMTNRQANTAVTVEVSRNGQSVASSDTRVGLDRTWGVTLDLSNQPDGTYSVDVDAGGTTYTRTFQLATATPTPAPTPTKTATPEPPETAAPEPTPTATPESPKTAAPEPTPTATKEPTPTQTPGAGGPGFGPVAGLLAVAAAIIMMKRRRRQ